jgi:hypothetical protein
VEHGWAHDPVSMLDESPDVLYSLDPAQVEEFRLAAAQTRFAAMRPAVAFLDRLAANQHLEEIETLDDLVPLLFQHTVYKAYPLSVLERSQFGKLTSWLGQLTSHQLDVDASGVTSIDDWLDLLDATSPMRVSHTSSTSGKLSFLPRSVAEIEPYMKATRQYHLGFGDEPSVDLFGRELPIIRFGYRYTYDSTGRHLPRLIEVVAGSAERCMATYPGKLSADMLSLAGRVQAAEARGELGRLELNPALLARRGELRDFQEHKADHLRDFVTGIKERFGGQQVLMLGALPHYMDAALEGERLGIVDVFRADSTYLLGGGFKNTAAPERWEERLTGFLGVGQLRECYGMQESLAPARRCPGDHYHVPPYLIPFALDPDSGEPRARHGVQTGRFAFLDLLVQSYWGGLITGDEVTIHWDEQCSCGRTGAFIDRGISRYSDKVTGDDKISCARIPEAHDKAVDYLVNSVR